MELIETVGIIEISLRHRRRYNWNAVQTRRATVAGIVLRATMITSWLVCEIASSANSANFDLLINHFILFLFLESDDVQIRSIVTRLLEGQGRASILDSEEHKAFYSDWMAKKWVKSGPILLRNSSINRTPKVSLSEARNYSPSRTAARTCVTCCSPLSQSQSSENTEPCNAQTQK